MSADDRAMGSFLFFAYGLGNGAYFPFAVGATTILISHAPKPDYFMRILLNTGRRFFLRFRPSWELWPIIKNPVVRTE